MSSWSASRSAWSSAERWAGATRLLPTCGYLIYADVSSDLALERPDMLHLRRESHSQIPQKINMIHRSKVISREHVPAKLLDDTVLRVAVGARGGVLAAWSPGPKPGACPRCARGPRLPPTSPAPGRTSPAAVPRCARALGLSPADAVPPRHTCHQTEKQMLACTNLLCEYAFSHGKESL